METQQQHIKKIINKFVYLSEKYHKLSLLFYELSQSLEIESRKCESIRAFNIYLKSLNLDKDKILKLTKGMSEVSLSDFQKDVQSNE